MYQTLLRQATALVKKLQDDITSGKKRICENYGQSEIRKFMDNKLGYNAFQELTYSQRCDIRDVLYEVANIS